MAGIDFPFAVNNEIEQCRSMMYGEIFSDFFAGFVAAINYGASDSFDWDAFIDYCNTPCYRYKA